MRKKSMVVTLGLAILLVVAFAQAAFAVPGKDKQSNSQGKAKVDAAENPPEEAEGDVKGNVKCTILHKGNEIRVSINALPAHILKHNDGLAPGVQDQDCQELFTKLTASGSGAMTSKETTPESSVETPNAQQENNSEETTEATGVSTETAKACDEKSIELNKEEKLTLDLHNKTRKENGLKALCVDPTLQKAARGHSKDMIKEDYFDHNSRNGETSGERLKGLGYDWRATGENLAWGSGSSSKPKSRFEAWMKSEGHKKNILDKNFEQVGVGVAKGELKKGGKEQTVYTVDFGTRKR